MTEDSDGRLAGVVGVRAKCKRVMRVVVGVEGKLQRSSLAVSERWRSGDDVDQRREGRLTRIDE